MSTESKTTLMGGTIVPTPESTKPTIDLKQSIEITKDQPEFTMDQFLEADFQSDEKLQAIFDKEHKSLPSFQEIVQRHTTDEGRKLLSNLRSDYSRKTQELAAAKKQLEEEKASFLKERELVVNSEFNKRNAELAKEDISALDLYNDVDMKKYLDIEMAKRLDEQIRPLREKADQERQVLVAEKFIAEHPEIKSDGYKQKLIAIYEKNPNVSLEDAYLMAKGMLADDVRTTETTKRTETKSFIKDTPTGRQVDVKSIPAGLSARQVALMLHKK